MRSEDGCGRQAGLGFWPGGGRGSLCSDGFATSFSVSLDYLFCEVVGAPASGLSLGHTELLLQETGKNQSPGWVSPLQGPLLLFLSYFVI